MSNKAFKVNQSLLLKPNTTEPASPQNGELYYDSASNKFKFRQNNEWAELGGGGEGSFQTLLTQSFETAVLGDFTQTGLELISSPFIHGAITARLIHQAASTYSFKQVLSVDPKFRGKNNTLRFDARSTAASANVTILVYDETNGAPLTSGTFTTGQITAAVFNTTNASASVAVTDNSILNSISIGASITGSGIPTGTTVIAKGTSTITLSQNATATATGVSLKVSVLPNIQSYSFNVPSNCSSLSYTISALQEAGLPETYVDDIIIELTQQALQSASITVPKNNDTNPVEFTPNFSNLNLGTGGTLFGERYREGAFEVYNVGFNLGSGGSITGTLTFVPPNSIDISAVHINYAAGSGNAISSVNVPVIATIDNSLALLVFKTDQSSTNVNGTVPFTWTSGNQLRVTIKVPIQGWSANETESKTIPLTSSVLVTEPDSYLQMNMFTVGVGSTGTKILTLGTPSYLNSKGDAIKYVKDAVNGDYFEALKDGEYSFTFNYDSNISASTVAGLGLSKNSNQLTTDYPSISAQHKLALVYSSDVPHITWTGGLLVGDKVRIHGMTGNHLDGSGSSAYSQLSMSYSGKIKILNPSSDQKVEIPTHELRFEGASTRGGTDTAVVKFDTLAKIKGDGFTVINTAANGTAITIKKKGKLSIDVTLVSLNAAVDNYKITKNQNNLTTTILPASEVLATQQIGNVSAAIASSSISAETLVEVGDVIRIASSVIPSSSTSNMLSLTLQEQSVSVALQNVAPRWDDSDTSVRISRSNGETISAVTDNIRFSSLDNVIGTGAYFNTNGFITTESGIFTLNAVVLCTTTATRGVDVYVNGSFYRRATDSISSDTFNVNLTDYFPINSYITLRFAGNGATLTTANGGHWFTISKVGKTQGTVDVTPFVNVRMHENIIGEVIAYPSNIVPENFLLCDGRAVSRTTYAELFNIIGVIHGSGDGSTTFNLPDYRGRFLRGVDGTAGLDPDKASRTAMNTGGNTGNNVGSVQTDAFQGHWHNFNTSNTAAFGNAGGNDATIGGGSRIYSVIEVTSPKSDGSNGTPRTSSETRPKNAYVNYIIRFAKDQVGIATPTEQVSSDTINFVFKSTAIVDSDPVGTYNTFTYTGGSNGATIAAINQTNQTSASMNTNGIQIFSRNLANNSSAGSPNRIDIKIGKGLKNVQKFGYTTAGKTGLFTWDYWLPTSVIEAGTFYHYNETTGILTIDGGTTISGVANKTLGYNQGSGSVTSAYFTFTASMTPSLVTIPNLQPKIAVISDVKTNGTDGGTSVSTTYVTRALNTLNDPNGIVTSLASNQFTLPAGQYHIEASAPAYVATNHRIRLRNITDSATAILGTSEYTASTMNVMSRSFISDTITIGSSKTFEIQHYVQTGNGGNGLGVRVNSSEQEIYTTVKITKIK